MTNVRYRAVILLLALLLAALPGLGAASATEPERGPVEQVEEVLELAQQVVDLTVEALDLYWTGWFLDRGLEEPWVLIQTLRPDESFTSACVDQQTGDNIVVSGLTNNAMYCSVDRAEDSAGDLINGVIILPLYPLALMSGGNMWGRGQMPPGNYAPVAMIAHEFSHLLNGDMRLNLRLIGVLHGILVIALIGYTILRSLRFSGGGRSSKKGGGSGVVAILLFGLALLVIGWVGVFFGRLIKSAVLGSASSIASRPSCSSWARASASSGGSGASPSRATTSTSTSSSTTGCCAASCWST